MEARTGLIGLLLFLLFIVLPAVELLLLIYIGGKIGFWPTVGIVVATGFLGAFLAKQQGTRAWRDVQVAMAEGRMPGRELLAGALFLVGAAFLLTPGVLTDSFGLLMMVPGLRRGAASAVARLLRGRVRVVGYGAAAADAGRAWRRRDVIDVDAEE